MGRVLAAIGFVALITSPAFASGFYLVQKAATKQCKIVETEPDGKIWVMVGTTTYPTLVEARAAKKSQSRLFEKEQSVSARTVNFSQSFSKLFTVI